MLQRINMRLSPLTPCRWLRPWHILALAGAAALNGCDGTSAEGADESADAGIVEPMSQADYYVRNYTAELIQFEAFDLRGKPVPLLRDSVSSAGIAPVFHARDASGSRLMPSDLFSRFRVFHAGKTLYEGVRNEDWKQDQDGDRVLTVESCPWSIDRLLLQVGATIPNRADCGELSLGLQLTAGSVVERFACFDTARADGRAVELSVNRCVDCSLPTTYLADVRGVLFAVTLEDDGFGDANRTATVEHCDNVVLDAETRDVRCQGAAALFTCSVPRALPKAPAP